MKPLECGVLKYEYNYDYLVCFKQPKDCGNWLGKLFGHVMLYRNVSATTSIRIEPTLGGTLIVPYKSNVKAFLSDVQVDYDTYVWIVKHKDVQGINVILFGTCVGIVKNLLGIKAWWVLIPWQLKRYIKKRRK